MDAQDECGDWVTALCPYGSTGCPDNDGDYDVVMPEPLMGTSSGYKVRVMDVNDVSDVDCSDEFYLLASEEAPMVGDEDGPSLVVTSPEEGDIAMAGGEYTVEVSLYLLDFGVKVLQFVFHSDTQYTVLYILLCMVCIMATQ